MVNRFNPRSNIQRNTDCSRKSCSGEHEKSNMGITERGNGVGHVQSNGCGLNTDCKALLRKLQMIDFAIVDTVLYLDAYPECGKALSHYNKLICEREGVRKALSEKCKRPMSSFENASADSWDWISSPWPWEASAN